MTKLLKLSRTIKDNHWWKHVIKHTEVVDNLNNCVAKKESLKIAYILKARSLPELKCESHFKALSGLQGFNKVEAQILRRSITLLLIKRFCQQHLCPTRVPISWFIQALKSLSKGPLTNSRVSLLKRCTLWLKTPHRRSHPLMAIEGFGKMGTHAGAHLDLVQSIAWKLLHNITSATSLPMTWVRFLPPMDQVNVLFNLHWNHSCKNDRPSPLLSLHVEINSQCESPGCPKMTWSLHRNKSNRELHFSCGLHMLFLLYIYVQNFEYCCSQ